MVAEFFNYSINSILYQRGIYPAEDFKLIKKYGLTLLITSNDKLDHYLQTIMTQVQGERNHRRPPPTGLSERTNEDGVLTIYLEQPGF